MPVDNEKIKQALDSFETDDFISAKEQLKSEIGLAVRDYFKDKLELQNDLESNQEPGASKDDVDPTDDTGTGTDDDVDDSE